MRAPSRLGLRDAPRLAPRRAAAALAFLAAAFAPGGYAQGGYAQGAAAKSEEELFGGGPALVEEAAAPLADLVSGRFEGGGGVELSGSLALAFSAGLEEGSFGAGAGAARPGLALSLDARPEAGFRVHARARYALTDTAFSGELGLEELFVDLALGKWGLLRLGKQGAAWGLGTWWSPADVLSLKPIDELDPEAEREGTVAASYRLPLGLGGLALYAAGDGASSLEELALAGRFELPLGGAELGIGGFYRPDGKVAPRLLGTASFGLGPLDCRAEGVLSLGHERRLADFSGAPSAASPDGLLFSGLVGAGYTGSDPEGRWKLALAAEYYYNGAGIAEGGAYAGHRPELLALLAAGELAAGDLRGYGRRYAALSLRAEELFGSGLGLGLDWLSNLAEGSGRWRAAAAFEPAADLRLEAGLEALYGPEGGEYSPSGRRAAFVAALRLFERATLGLELPLAGEGEARASLEVSAEF